MSNPEFPDLPAMAEAYTKANFLEQSRDVNYPKVLVAMQIAASATQRYNNSVVSDTLKKVKHAREIGDKPNK